MREGPRADTHEDAGVRGSASSLFHRAVTLQLQAWSRDKGVREGGLAGQPVAPVSLRAWVYPTRSFSDIALLVASPRMEGPTSET